MSGGEIVYLGIADSSRELLVAHSTFPSINVIIEQLLQSVDFLVNHKKSFQGHAKTRGHTIQYIVDEELCFISSASEGFPQRICFAFLERIKDEFYEKYASNPRASTFKDLIVSEMNFFSNNPEADKIRGLQSKVEQIKDIMHENVEKLIIRGEKIENIESKAEDLRSQTKAFDKKTKEVRCVMCTKNIKMTICLIVVVLSILISIGVIIFIILSVMGYGPMAAA